MKLARINSVIEFNRGFNPNLSGSKKWREVGSIGSMVTVKFQS